MSKKKRKKMRGTVQKIIKPVVPGEQEKAQISVEEVTISIGRLASKTL